MANGPDSAPASKKLINISINEPRKAGYEKLVGLSVKLNARISDLVWDAVTKYVANPPTIAPVGSRGPRGTSYGFWVVHKFDPAGKIQDIFLTEGVRGKTDGAHFFRYKVDDKDSREKALNQANHCALYDARLSGFRLPDKGPRVLKA
jgi:hypothetical protein